jgi:SAM-dependent methyltransferase
MSARVEALPEAAGFWERQARVDPFLAVMPGPGGSGASWRLDEFFETGRNSVEIVLGRLGELKIHVRLGSALDFGCGPGRLTQALAARFENTLGVDVSSTMIEAAERCNRFPGRCRYAVNKTDDLGFVDSGSVDFLLSDSVLQHIRPAISMAYLSEFARVLAPGGIAVFYLPGRRVRRGPWSSWNAVANKIRYGTATSMDYGIQRETVDERLRGGGTRVVEVREGDWLDRGQFLAAPRPGLATRVLVWVTYNLSDRWEKLTYIVVKMV